MAYLSGKLKKWRVNPSVQPNRFFKVFLVPSLSRKGDNTCRHTHPYTYCSFILSSQKYLKLQGKEKVQEVERVTKSEKRAVTLKKLLMAGFLFMLPCAIATIILLFQISQVVSFQHKNLSSWRKRATGCYIEMGPFRGKKAEARESLSQRAWIWIKFPLV